MATPTYSEVITQINTFIVTNHNNEITAEVLNPILVLLTDFTNNTIGDLEALTTDEKETIVEAINSLKNNFNDITNNGVQLYTGMDDPNVTPPPTYKPADFYLQVDQDDLPIQLWQFNAFAWVMSGEDTNNEWGSITGDISNQLDLMVLFNTKADQTDLDAHIDDTENPHQTTAIQVPAIPSLIYLTGANVQEQLNNTESNLISGFKISKINIKDLYQTGLIRPDVDVSVLTIAPADTLTITQCDRILFINDVLPDVPANLIADFIHDYGDKVFVVNATNTPLTAGTRGIFYVGLDRLGNTVYRTSKVYDLDICYMARLLVQNAGGTYTIVSAKYFPDIAYNNPVDKDRKVSASGYIVPSGAASISFGNRGVSFSKNSINYSNNKFDPNYLTVADTVNPNPMQFLFAVPNITSLAVNIALSTTINPAQWYLASGVVGAGSVANTSYQVYRLLVTVTGTMVIQTKASTVNTPQFGVNAIFANRDDALAGLNSVVFPDILPAGDAITLGKFLLRAGTNANGSQLIDPNDFYFQPSTSTSSSSSVGVTSHDLLSGKNDNPAFLHVTSADIANWNAKQNQTGLTLNTVVKQGASSFVNSSITDSGIGAGGIVNINNFIGGITTRVLPSGNTTTGRTIVLTGTDNTSRLIQRDAIQYNEDGFSGGQINGFEKSIVFNKSTAYNGTINVLTLNPQIGNSGNITGLTTAKVQLSGAGTGTIGTYIAWGTNPILLNNTNTITNYIAFDSTFNPQNNNLNAWGVRIGDLLGGAISRGIETNVSAGTGKWNAYFQGTANNYFNGNVLIGTTNNTAGVKFRVGGTSIFDGDILVPSAKIAVTMGGANNDPYGIISVTRLSDTNNYNYYGLTREGQVGWAIGIDISNKLYFGAGSVDINPFPLVTIDLGGHVSGANATAANHFVTKAQLDAIGGGISGTGTANRIVKWSGATTQTDSVIYDNGTNVSIGTTTPAPSAKFQINVGSDHNIGFINASEGVYISTYNDAANANKTLYLDALDFTFLTSGVERIRIDPNGNVGIGTTTPTDITGYRSLSLAGGGCLIDMKVGSTGAMQIVSDISGSYFNESRNLPLSFLTQSNLRMTILGNGNVGIGTTNPLTKLEVVGGIHLNSQTNAFVIGLSSPTNFAQIYYNATNKGLNFTNSTGVDTLFINDSTTNIGIGTTFPTEKLHVGGNILATGTVTASSDERLKTNIQPLQNSLEKILKVKGIKFDRTDTKDKNQIGFIAQDLEKVFPELVKTQDTPEGLKSVNYQVMVAVLVEAIKELKYELNHLRDTLKL